MVSLNGGNGESSSARRRGRPIGATSWWRNPANIAAHHAKNLLELWLAVAPILEIRLMLPSLVGSPEHQALIEECWRNRGNEQRFTIPKPITRKLCKLAIAHVMELHQAYQAAEPQVKDILRRSRAAAEAKLRDSGWTEDQIAAWFNKLQPAQGRGPKNFKVPDIRKVLEIVSRSAPAQTLRRKAAFRKLRRKNQAA